MADQRFIQDVDEALESIDKVSSLEDFGGSQAKLDRFQEQLESLVELIDAPTLSQLKLCQTLFTNVAPENYRFEISKFIKTLNTQAQKAEVDFTIITDKSRGKPLEEKQVQIHCQSLSGQRAVKAQQHSEVAELDRTIQSQGIASNVMEIKKMGPIFVSYAETNETEVQELLALVKSQAGVKGITTDFWCFKNELLAGENFNQQIQQALNDATFGLLCCSTDFFNRPYIIASELPYFNGQPLPDGKIPRQIPYIPVRLRNIDYEDLPRFGLEEIQVASLNGTCFIDLNTISEKEAFAKHIVNQMLKKKAQSEQTAELAQQKCSQASKKLIHNQGLTSKTGPDDIESDNSAINSKAEIDARELQSSPIDNNGTDREEGNEFPVVPFLQEWGPETVTPKTLKNRYLAILGEYGMGKTWSCIRFAMQQITRHQEDKTQPLAIYLDLRRYAEGDEKLTSSSAPVLKEIIRITLVRQLGDLYQDFTADDVLDLVRNQGAIIIFDGLDEVANYLSEPKKKAFYHQLVSILPKGLEHNPEQFKQPGKLILSCRSNQFASFEEETNLFNEQRGDGKWQFRILHMLPFTMEQIRQYLQQNLPDKDPDVMMQMLADVHNLTELAKRPYNLNLIREQIKDIEEHKVSGQPFYGVTLYQNLVKLWLERDDPKHQFNKEYKPLIMQHLAAYLHKRQLRELPHKELRQWLGYWLMTQPQIKDEHDKIDPEALASDLRTATFICRPEADKFRFAHTSLQEFFLAQHLFEGLLSDPTAILSSDAEAKQEERLNRWAIENPSPETLEFLRQLILSAPEQREEINQGVCKLLETYQPKRSELFFRFWLDSQRQGLALPRPAKIDMRGAKLYQWKYIFSKHLFNKELMTQNALINLRHCDFRGADLISSDWQGIDFSFSQFDQADVRGSRWRYCKMQHCNFSAVEFSGSKMLACQLQDAVNLPAQGIRLSRSLPAPPTHPQDRLSELIFPWATTEHSSSVSSVAFSHDNRRMITASNDNTAKIWDADPQSPTYGQCLLTLSDHQRAVNSAAFSHDNRRIITASDDKTAKIWDADQQSPTYGQCLLTLSDHQRAVNSAAFSPDNRRIITASEASRGNKGIAKIWDADPQSPTYGQCLLTLYDHNDMVFSAAFSHDNRRMITASGDLRGNKGTAKIWDADPQSPAYGQCLLALSDHQRAVNSAAFSHDNRRIITASDDKTAKIWDADPQSPTYGQCLLTLSDHNDMVLSAAFSHDNRRIITANNDNTAKIWDVDPQSLTYGQCLLTLSDHNDMVLSAAFSPDNRRIITASGDLVRNKGTAKIWDADLQSLTFGQCLLTLSDHQRAVNSAAFSHDNRRMITASSDLCGNKGTAKIWDSDPQSPTYGQCLLTLSDHQRAVNSAAFSHDNRRIITASDDKTAKIWDADPQSPTYGQCLLTLSDHSDWVRSAAFSPDNRRIITASSDRSAKIWDADPQSPTYGQCLHTLSDHSVDVKCAAFSPDSRRLIIAGVTSFENKGFAKIWDADPQSPTYGQCLLTLSDHNGMILCAAFSPNNTLIITANDTSLEEKGSAKIWDADPQSPTYGQCLLTLSDHSDWVRSAAFSPDNRRIITASDDNTSKIWDAEPLSSTYGQCLLTLSGHQSSVRSAAFSPDDTRIITASFDSTAKIWDAETGQCLQTMAHLPEEQWAVFDDKKFIALSEEAWQWVGWQDPKTWQISDLD